ncbi:hypothetical protein [Streptomyces sp. NPDC059874]|uniref:hypothetical protein n=1 Tax=Streptomyces sp. NPDC059874 TaxID=3346983 RepID=UPI003665B73F
MLRVTKETKAVLTADTGRVIGFVKDTEPGKASLAVPGDRAILTPAQMRALAAWLNETAAEQEKVIPPREAVRRKDWLTAERAAQRMSSALNNPRAAW